MVKVVKKPHKSFKKWERKGGWLRKKKLDCYYKYNLKKKEGFKFNRDNIRMFNYTVFSNKYLYKT